MGFRLTFSFLLTLVSHFSYNDCELFLKKKSNETINVGHMMKKNHSLNTKNISEESTNYSFFFFSIIHVVFLSANHGHLSPCSGDPRGTQHPRSLFLQATSQCCYSTPVLCGHRHPKLRQESKSPWKRLGAEKARNLEIPTNTNKKAPTKACSL